MFPYLERDAQSEPLDEVEVDRRVWSGRLESAHGRVEAGNDSEFSEQLVLLVVANLDDVRRNLDPNSSGPIRLIEPMGFHCQTVSRRRGARPRVRM